MQTRKINHFLNKIETILLQVFSLASDMTASDDFGAFDVLICRTKNRQKNTTILKLRQKNQFYLPQTV